MSNKLKKIIAFASAAAITMTMSGMAFAVESEEEATDAVLVEDATELATLSEESEIEAETVVTYGGFDPEAIAQYGDLNGDKSVDAIDAVLVLSYYAEYLVDETFTLDEFLYTDEEEEEETVDVAANTSEDETEIETEEATEEAVPSLADFDGDGIISSREAVGILVFYANVIVKNEPAYSLALSLNPDEEETVAEEATEEETQFSTEDAE